MTDLNTRIAEARGYAVIADQHGGAMMTTRDADGRLLLDALIPVPDWEHDLNLAWNDLMVDMLDDEAELLAWWGGATIKLFDESGYPHRVIECTTGQSDYRVASRSAAHVAAAICEAWLAWHEAQTIDAP